MKKDPGTNRSEGIRIRVSGDTVEHLFINAADAMADMLSANRYANITSMEHVRIEANNWNAALVDFLNELLKQSHAERAVHIPESVKVKEGGRGVIVQATVYRYLVPAFDEDIKKAMHHDVDIVNKKGVWETALAFDI